MHVDRHRAGAEGATSSPFQALSSRGVSQVLASSEPGAPRPVPGAIKASASMTRAGSKLLSKTAGKVSSGRCVAPEHGRVGGAGVVQ